DRTLVIAPRPWQFPTSTQSRAIRKSRVTSAGMTGGPVTTQKAIPTAAATARDSQGAFSDPPAFVIVTPPKGSEGLRDGVARDLQIVRRALRGARRVDAHPEFVRRGQVAGA